MGKSGNFGLVDVALLCVIAGIPTVIVAAAVITIARLFGAV